MCSSIIKSCLPTINQKLLKSLKSWNYFMDLKFEWNKIVSAPFKKVVKYDLLCIGIDFVIGLGVGAW